MSRCSRLAVGLRLESGPHVFQSSTRSRAAPSGRVPRSRRGRAARAHRERAARAAGPARRADTRARDGIAAHAAREARVHELDARHRPSRR